MLKISEDRKEPFSVTLRLEGRVVGPWAGELMKIAETLLAGEAKLTLELADVSFADENGVTVLAALSRRGVTLLQLSPFVAEQLKAATAPAA